MNHRSHRRIWTALAVLGWLAAQAAGTPRPLAREAGQAAAAERTPLAAASSVVMAQFSAEVMGFLSREIAAHVAAVERLDPPQATVLGVGTTGDFTWGSFMRALSECSALAGTRAVAGRDVPAFLGQLGLIEARQGGKTFAQLYAALALRQFGTNLNANALWQGLTTAQQAEWRSLLDPGRFYDRQTRRVINLPENYLGVASRIVAIDFQLGLITDRAYVDDVLDAAAGQFLRGERYADDALPAGRYDRYSQEYARYVYLAATDVGRQDIVAAVTPALTAVVRTWWALVSPDGYGYPWGRTIGAIGYMDTMEIVGFLAAHPEFRPAPLSELASAYGAAWRWLQRDYQADRHLLNMFGFGRGNFSYMTPARQWQQTTAYLSKAADSFRLLDAALRAEGVSAFPGRPALPDVARFDWFRRGDRSAGVWLVRQGGLRFALPITTGTKAGIADYLAAPHGLPGFAVPVEQFVPAAVPYLELADGRVIAAADGADTITPATDGRSLVATWRRWVVVGGEPATFVEPGLATEVSWRIEGTTVIRRERMTAAAPVTIRRLSMAIPSTADRVSTRFEGRERIDRLSGPDGALEVVVTGLPVRGAARATGNTALGKGARGPVPLILEFEATDLAVTPDQPLDWILTTTVIHDATAPVPVARGQQQTASGVEMAAAGPHALAIRKRGVL
jgi:hypothetical protein